MEEDSFKQTFFSLATTLSNDAYQMMDKQFQKEKTKTFYIIHKNDIIGKLHSSIIEEDEYIEAFTLFENNKLILPERMNPQLINVLINYFYFKEIKQLSIKLIFDFLDLLIYFNLNDLIVKVVAFLKANLTNAAKCFFIRKNIFPFIFEETSGGEKENKIKRLFDDSELFLLKNNYLEEYLAFYVHDYFSHPNNEIKIDLEEEILKRIEMINRYNIDGLLIIKLLILFKDHLIEEKKNRRKYKNYQNS